MSQQLFTFPLEKLVSAQKCIRTVSTAFVTFKLLPVRDKQKVLKSQ